MRHAQCVWPRFCEFLGEVDIGSRQANRKEHTNIFEVRKLLILNTGSQTFDCASNDIIRFELASFLKTKTKSQSSFTRFSYHSMSRVIRWFYLSTIYSFFCFCIEKKKNDRIRLPSSALHRINSFLALNWCVRLFFRLLSMKFITAHFDVANNIER